MPAGHRMSSQPEPGPEHPPPAKAPVGSFTGLFARNRDRILRFARFLRVRGKHAEGAETMDYVQEASAEFLKKPRDYGSESHFRHLFLGFVKNAFRGRRRQDGAAKRGGDVEPEALPQGDGNQPAADLTGPMTSVQRDDLRAAVRGKLALLREDYRQIIVLRLWEEHSWEQIAAAMQLDSADAARKKYGYALGHLRLAFGA
jgi:RNA polymerase sigma factor (sigma-70 family)